MGLRKRYEPSVEDWENAGTVFQFVKRIASRQHCFKLEYNHDEDCWRGVYDPPERVQGGNPIVMFERARDQYAAYREAITWILNKAGVECRSCFWYEGGRCYQGDDFERDEHGVSDKVADCVCVWWVRK